MGKFTKISTEEFIAKARDLHGDTYLYDKVDYNGCHEKVTIKCREHGDFRQKPTLHLRGSNCLKCAAQTIGRVNAERTASEFVQKSVAVHGNKYDYSLVEYKHNKLKVEIICGKHGLFSQTPHDHLLGKGCRRCGADQHALPKKIKASGEFESRGNSVHGNKYDYSLVRYVRSSDKVKIICPEHGVFEQSPNKHLAGQGCTTCAQTGYSHLIPGHIYVLQVDNITKVGITNKHPSERAKQVSKSSGKSFDVVFSLKFEDGKVPRDVERALLRELRGLYDHPPYKFDGWTESFVDLDFIRLIGRLYGLVKSEGFQNA